MRLRILSFSRWQFILIILTCLLLGAYLGSLFMVSNPSPSAASPSGQNSPVNPVAGNYRQSLPMSNISIADISEQASPAVVKVTAYYKSINSTEERFWREFFGWPTPQEREGESFGTGFFIDQNGYILTNEHVIRNASRLEIKMKGEKTPLEASLVGASRDLDLALLKVSGRSRFPFLQLGDSDKIRVGEWVIAIGNPMGLDHTVTVGVVSAKDRPIATQTEDGPRTYRNLIQTDAAINRGNSGGPLLNTAGKVIGINTMVMDVRQTNAVGIGFAIAINTVKKNLEALKAGGDEVLYKGQGWLGFSLADMNDYYRYLLYLPQSLEGVVVTHISLNGPAHKAGVEPGDVVMALNNVPTPTVTKFKAEIKKYSVNNVIQLKIYRDGRIGTISVRLERSPKSGE